MIEDNSKHKFENLQPIAFLKKFNKMVDDDGKYPLHSKSKQLKVFPLTRFPLPHFYAKMEGIFQTGTRKKDIIGSNIKNKDDIQDEEFLEKHRLFMTKAIEKIILENQQQQESLNRYRKQYEPRKLEPSHRTKSEPKFRKTHKSVSSSHGTENMKEYQTLNTKQEDMQSPEEVKNYTYLEKVQQQRMESFRNLSKQKIKIKNQREVRDFLSSRKESVQDNKIKSFQTLSSVPLAQYDNMTSEDRKKAFIEELLKLQKEQNKYQTEYGKNIQREIGKFNNTVQESIQSCRKQKFW